MFRWQNIMRFVNKETLLEEHEKQSRRKATGVDGVTKDEYDVDVHGHIDRLLERMKRFQYRPQPVRRTYIPKANGKLRPLGIPAYEDKLVQGVMASVLSDIYEGVFLDCSYGFRPGRSCHDVDRYLNQTIMTKKVNYVLEADIKGFFDNVNHDWLMRFLEHDIADRPYLRYVRRFLKAGIMEDGKHIESNRGTPQGGLISPTLANVYLHYVLDLWFEKVIQPRLRGEAHYVRYADDFLVMFQYEDDAKAVIQATEDRFAKKYGLSLAEAQERIDGISEMGRTAGLDFRYAETCYTNTLGAHRLTMLAQQNNAKLADWLEQRFYKAYFTESLELVDHAVLTRIAVEVGMDEQEVREVTKQLQALHVRLHTVCPLARRVEC